MQYGTKGEGRDGATGGLPNGGEGGQAAEAAAETTSAERDSRTLDYLITVIGFGLCRAWIVFCLGAPLIAGAASSFTWAYLLFGALSALTVSFVANRSGKREGVVRVALFRATPVALAASGIIIPVALALNSEALMIVGFVAGGLGAGPLQVLWGDRFARHATLFAAVASPAAAIVTALVAGMSNDHTSFIGFAVIPLLSFGLLLFEANRTGLSWSDLTQKPKEELAVENANADDPSARSTSQRDAEEEPGAKFGVGKLMFSIMTFSFLCRLFDAIPAYDDPFAFVGGSAIFGLIVVGVVFLVIVAKLRERFNAALTYRLSLPIMVAGFVAIALFFDTHAAMSILLINAGYEFFDILTWVLFVDVSRRRNENALHIFGLGVAFMFAGMGAGTMAGRACDAMIASGDMQISAVAMLATLCLVVVAFMVLPEGVVAQLSQTMRTSRKEKDVEEAPAVAVVDAGAGRLEQHCASVARDYGLTPRESEVIVLLAYGRTLSIIARDLQIAKGTARTHIENIYRKLDVHKQQELIDQVETYE